MRRLLTTLTVFCLASTAEAHFVFLVPEAGGTKAKAVLSDGLEPDDGVDIASIAPTKLFVRAGGADAPLTWTKAEHAYTLAIPGQGPRVVFGTTDYGVMQRGATKPYFLRYHAKAVLGDLAAVKALGDVVPVEVVPEGAAGQVRFRVLAHGKPLASSEVTVIVPGQEESRKVTTDADGRTPSFAPTGRYGVWARFFEAKAGEHGGKKYDEVRNYATLVVDVK